MSNLTSSAKAGSSLTARSTSGFKTMNPRGSSPAKSSATPTTAASAMQVCVSRWPSNSAGGTWNPLTYAVRIERNDEEKKRK